MVSTVLDTDVGPCAVGLTIGARNVVLDLAGHTVFGTAGSDGEGITFDNVSNSVVRNGTVREFDVGVVDRGQGNTIKTMDLRDYPVFDGALIFRSDNTQFLSNRVVNNGRF